MGRRAVLAIGITCLVLLSTASIFVLPSVAQELIEDVIPCSPIVESLDIESIFASGTSDTSTNVANLFDGNPQTVWTNLSERGSGLTIKLKEPKIVCSVDIAFANGQQAEHTFAVYVSTTGQTFNLAYDGLSGTQLTNEPQHFILDHKYFGIQYLKIDFDNDLVSVSELYIDMPNPDRFRQPSSIDGQMSSIEFGELKGVNFIDPVLMREQRFNPLDSTRDYHVNTYIPKLARLDLDLIRLPVNWEAYEASPTVFLDELELLVKTADDNGIYVWIDVQHFYATSYWRDSECGECRSYSVYGKGFPKSVVSQYHPSTTYDDPEVFAFWDDYYNNNIRGVNNVWQKHADFMKTIIDRIDHYDNVIGYEIINEPHVFKKEHYTQLGLMQTFIGKEIREVTDKAIIFTRETAHQGFLRQSDLEYLVLPKVEGKLIYAPHIYNVENADFHIGKWKSYQDTWSDMGYHVDLAVGEWAMQPPQTDIPTQQISDAVIEKFYANNLAWTYWAYAGFGQNEGNVLMLKDGTLTEEGKYVINSVNKYYN